MVATILAITVFVPPIMWFILWCSIPDQEDANGEVTMSAATAKITFIWRTLQSKLVWLWLIYIAGWICLLTGHGEEVVKVLGYIVGTIVHIVNTILM